MSKKTRITNEKQLREGVAKGLSIGSESLDMPYADDSGEMQAERESYLVFTEDGKASLSQALEWAEEHGYTDKFVYPIY